MAQKSNFIFFVSLFGFQKAERRSRNIFYDHLKCNICPFMLRKYNHGLANLEVFLKKFANKYEFTFLLKFFSSLVVRSILASSIKRIEITCLTINCGSQIDDSRSWKVIWKENNYFGVERMNPLNC